MKKLARHTDKTSTMSRGFTLIELLVVISIVSMLSSVVIATVQPMRAKAKDAVRLSQSKQIDAAIQNYILDKGHAPELSSCASQKAQGACRAVSTASLSSDSIGAAAWSELMGELVPKYLSSVPQDPCGTGSSCTTDDGRTFGFVYVAPLTTTSGEYLLSSSLQSSKKKITYGGNNSGGTGFAIVNDTGSGGQNVGNKPVINLSADPDWTNVETGSNLRIGWTTSGATSCVLNGSKDGLFAGNYGPQDLQNQVGITVSASELHDDSVTLTCTNSSGSTVATHTFSVVAVGSGGGGGESNSGLAIYSFNISPNPTLQTGPINLSWEVTALNNVVCSLSYGDLGSFSDSDFEGLLGSYSGSGSTVLAEKNPLSSTGSINITLTCNLNNDLGDPIETQSSTVTMVVQ